MHEPLAYKMRPETLDDVVGQNHLIGDNKILTNLIKNTSSIKLRNLYSLLYYTFSLHKTTKTNFYDLF